MAEDFQARIGASDWWNLSKSAFSGGSPPCLTGYSDIGGYGWSATDMVDVKGMFYEEPNSVSGISFDFLSAEKAQILDSASEGGSILIDSDSSTMGFSLSSLPTSDWNHILLSRGNGRTENSLKSLFVEDVATKVNYQPEEPIRIDHHRSSRIQKDWSRNDLSTIVEDNNSITSNTFKSADQDFYTAVGCLNSDILSENDYNFSTGFPVGSASYGQALPLLQNLLNSQTQQSSILANNRSSNSSYSSDFRLSCDESSSAWPKVPSSYQKTSISQHQNVGFFSKNTPFWNSSSSAAKNSWTVLSPSSQSQLMASSLAEKPKCHNLTTKKLQLYAGEDVQHSGLIGKRLNGGGGDLAFKRSRIETPSPLPTFKVRKEKLGDRITALQQLVSPFGKTDTASVLHEAIDYIKFLHEQVGVLSTPYMKSGASNHHLKEPEEATQELRNRGLCLVPISSTFSAASETTPEFWTPTFGSTFK